MEKPENKSRKIVDQTPESGEKTTLGSYQSSKDVPEKKNYQQPIIFDSENLERLNNDTHTLDLKMIRKNLFSRQKPRPVFQRAATSHQFFRFNPQKNDFVAKINELEQKYSAKSQRRAFGKNNMGVTGNNFGNKFNNFVEDSNFVNAGMEKINPKYNDAHLKYI